MYLFENKIVDWISEGGEARLDCHPDPTGVGNCRQPGFLQ
jgi:hypothetical protein